MTETTYLWIVVIMLSGVIIFGVAYNLAILWQWWGRR